MCHGCFHPFPSSLPPFLSLFMSVFLCLYLSLFDTLLDSLMDLDLVSLPLYYDLLSLATLFFLSLLVSPLFF